MRLVIALAALAISLCSIAADGARVSAGGAICRLGLCRFDQIFRSIDASGPAVSSLAELVNQDPRNPYAWCVFGDVLAGDALAGEGDLVRATAAFDRAIELGPHMPPALMRAANYYFTHGELAKALRVSYAVLRQTDAFDQVLFSYFRLLRIPTSQLLGGRLLTGAVPATPRAARSWLDWVRANGSDQDLLETWSWMKSNGLLDRSAAAGALWTLWYRQSYAAAHRLWLDFPKVSPATGTRELLTNSGFDEASSGGPFDWILEGACSVSLTQRDGLDVNFAGTGNIAFSGVRQGVFLKPGRYRFTAEVASEGLTTDQTPFFHLFDPAHPEAIHAASPQIKGTTPRSPISVAFQVPAGTQAVVVQLERQASSRFDNKIRGTLHLYRVSLEPSYP
jgi:hypothetical protein